MNTCICFEKVNDALIRIGTIELCPEEATVGGWIVVNARLYEIDEVWTVDGTAEGTPLLRVTEVD